VQPHAEDRSRNGEKVRRSLSVAAGPSASRKKEILLRVQLKVVAFVLYRTGFPASFETRPETIPIIRPGRVVIDSEEIIFGTLQGKYVGQFLVVGFQYR
jgi:hypothetical protein